jgi:DNA-binding Lrp family transcriptional regulator
MDNVTSTLLFYFPVKIEKESMSRPDVRVDEIDLQILKILTHNCRTSYRSIGKTLGISVNTVRSRINDLILNKTIEQFITLVNFSLFGYIGVLIIILKVSKNRQSIISNVVKSVRWGGSIYQHIEIFDGVHVFSIAVRNAHVNNDYISSLTEKLYKDLGKSISVLDIFYGRPTSMVSDNLHVHRIDLKILECLLSNPRMTFLNIAKTIGCSQKTIIRRIEMLKSGRVIMGFSLLYNPSNMKGYNYFSVILHTRSGMAPEVMKEISYSHLSDQIIRFPPFTFHDRVIIIFHIENVLDIESIVRKVRSIKGVVKAETYQPIRIKWEQEWLKKRIRNRIVTIEKRLARRMSLEYHS